MLEDNKEKEVKQGSSQGLRINHDIKSKVRAAGNVDTDVPDFLNDKIREVSQKISEQERQRRMKLLYPDWNNLDAGKIEFYSTDKPGWVKLVVVNVDYPGVCIVPFDKLLEGINNARKIIEAKYKEKDSKLLHLGKPKNLDNNKDFDN